MQLLGHSQIAMTMHYTHVVPELAREAANRAGVTRGPDDAADLPWLQWLPRWLRRPFCPTPKVLITAGQTWSRLAESNRGQPHYE